MNRQHRRAAGRTIRELGTLDHHFASALRDVRVAFDLNRYICAQFRCVTATGVFSIPAIWNDPNERAVAPAALRETFRRRGVRYYIFVSECWASEDPVVHPSEAADRTEHVQVFGAERGACKYAMAEITRNEETATLGPWIITAEAQEGWLSELLEDVAGSMLQLH